MIKKYTFLIFLFTTCLKATTSDVPVEKDGMSVEKIKKDLEKLQTFIYKHLGSHEAPADAIREMPKDAASLMFDKIMSLQAQVTKLISQLEEAAFKLQQHQKDIFADKKTLEDRIKDLETRLESFYKQHFSSASHYGADTLAGTNSSTTRLSPRIPTSPEEIYDHAQALIKSNQISSGEAVLRQIIQDFPSTPILKKVYLDLTILLENQKRYEEASNFTALLYKMDPQSVEAQQALLKMSSMLYKMDKKIEACSVLTKLLTQYPNIEKSFQITAQSLQSEYHCAEPAKSYTEPHKN